jgi:hypothetical protein
MRRRAIFLAVLVFLVIANIAIASVLDYNMPRYVLGAGGGRVAAGSYVLEGTVGQAVVDTVSAGPYQIQSGFWHGLDIFRLLLPLISR